MALDFYIFDQSGQNVTTRYELGDLIDVIPSKGTLPIPNTSSPFRIVRVTTAWTKDDIMAYLAPKTGAQARRRLYYLDTTRMSAADLTYWNTNRAIATDQATAMGWLRSK